MTKAELIDKIAESTELDRKSAEAAVAATFSVIAGALADGDKVIWNGFGTFLTRRRSARNGINPATKEQMEYPASTVAAFRPAKVLKDQVNHA